MSLEKSKEELLEDGYAELAKSNLNDPEFFGNYRKELKAQKDLYKNLLNLALQGMNSALDNFQIGNWTHSAYIIKVTQQQILEELPKHHDK